MKITNILFINMLSMLFITSYSKAQTSAYNGTWTFKDQQSVSGNLYANGSPKQVTIAQNNQELSISTLVNNGTADTTITEVIAAAKALETKAPKTHRKIVTTLQWSANASSFTETMTVYSKSDPEKADYRNTDEYYLTDGVLILDRKSQNFANGETWESKATYTKN